MLTIDVCLSLCHGYIFRMNVLLPFIIWAGLQFEGDERLPLHALHPDTLDHCDTCSTCPFY